MMFFLGLVAALLFARAVTHGKTEERPDTTGNTMRDAQLERALAKVADELDLTLNPTMSVAEKNDFKERLKAFKMENAQAFMNSSAGKHSRKMATKPGRTHSAHV